MIDVTTDFDTLLLHGALLDGSGAPARRADVGLRGDRIAAVGALADATARQTLDCSGLTLAPGLLDVHSHSDAYLLIEPGAPSKVRQGITTEVVGQCGLSAAPLLGEARLPSDWASFTYPAPWRSMADYRALLERQGSAVNVVALAGHRNLRLTVMGTAPRPARPDEIQAMERLLDQALDEGAGGFSTGLIYEPSKHARPDEIEALARRVARHGGVYATHMRSEKARLLEALDEAIGVARSTGVRLQISHLKTAGKASWHLAPAAAERIEAARHAGCAVHADRYPYLASCTALDILLPGWAGQNGGEAVLARLRDPATRRRIAEEIAATQPPGFDSEVRIGATWCAQTHPFRGRFLDEAAAELRLSPAEALLWIVERDALRTEAFFFSMCAENLRFFLSQPWVMAGSDASLRSPQGPLSHDHPHPRAYGSHARLLALARGEGPLSLAETVRRMTSLPAQAFGLSGYGSIAPGAVADLAVFDAATVCDRSTYAEPHRFAEGVRHVFVAGMPVLLDGRDTPHRPGRWLVPAG